MNQPERVSGLQSFLYLRPEGSKLSHQLGGILPCERFDRGQRAFIWRNCVPHTYNGSETLFWTATAKKSSDILDSRHSSPVPGWFSQQKTAEIRNGPQGSSMFRKCRAPGESIPACIDAKNTGNGT